MATQFAPASLPPSVAPLPFLFACPQVADRGWNFSSALAASVAAERADMTRRNTRGRIAYLLCELGYQLSRRGEDRDTLPLSRGELATALGVSLCRVKRTLALLELSAVTVSDGVQLRVLDWRRLCGVAHFQLGRIGLAADDDSEPLQIVEQAQAPANQLTAAGDPACFV
jgi:hypothetical protein